MPINLGDLNKQREEEYKNSFIDLDGLHVSKNAYSNSQSRLRKLQEQKMDAWEKQKKKDYERENASFLERTINTIADVGLDVVEGGLGYLEGGVDWASYRLADLSNLIGQEQWAKGLRENADFDSTGTWFGKNKNEQDNIFGNWTEGIENKSYSNDFVDQIFQGVGQVGMAAGTSVLTGGSSLATAGIVYASSYGNARSEAKRNGASDEEANKVGVIHGIAEAISEQFFSGIPGMKVEGWGDKFSGKLSDKISGYFGTRVGKIALKTFDSLGEGAEEILSNVLVAAGNDITHYFDNNFSYGMEGQTGNLIEDTLAQFTDSDSLTQFISASITSALVNGAKNVIDTRTQNKIINAYAKDNNMSFNDAKYILTGEETLNQVKQEIKQDKTEYNSNVELEEMAKDRMMNYAQQTNTDYINQRINEMEEDRGKKFTKKEREGLFNAFKNRTETEINSPQRYENFKLEKEPTNEQEKVLYDSFVKNSNNTQQAHNLYDFYSKLRKDNPNANYQLTSNDELVEMGLLEKQGDKYGRTINGKFVEETPNGINLDGKILINRDGLNAFEATTWHEIAHSIKDTSPEGYTQLKNIIKQVYGENDFDNFKQKYENLYGDNQENLEDEYVNDKLGELLNNERFYNRVTENRNLLQRIIDKLKEMVKYISSNTEQRNLMKIQKKLEDTYMELYKETKFEGKQDAKYSLSQDGEMIDNTTGEKATFDVQPVETSLPTNKTLMAIHNLNESKLNGVLDLGGFPVPSIAITQTKNVGSNQFGNISVIFDKNTINPENRLNEVYDRDVWTPTFPSVEYDIDNEMLRNLSKENNFYNNNEDSIISSARNSYLYSENLADLVDRHGIEAALEQMKKDNKLKYLYLKTMDNNYQAQMKPTQYSYDYSNDALKEYVDLYNSNEYNDMSLPDFYYHYLNYGDMNLTDDQTKAIKATIRDILYKEYKKEAKAEYEKAKQRDSFKNNPMSEEKFVEQYTKMMLESFDESYFKYKDFIKDASRLAKFGETQSIDESKTLQKVDEDINQEEYEKWVDNTFGNLLNNAKKGIRNDVDLFTSSGNRRSWDKLHDNYDLQSIVKYMTKQQTIAGEKGFGAGSGFGTLQAQMSKRFDTIDEIRDYANERIIHNTEEKDLLKPYEDKIYEDMEELAEYYPFKDDKYSYPLDTIGYALNDFAGYKKQDITNLKKALKEYSFDTNKIPTELMNKIVGDVNSLKTIPTDYFEAKPQRAVGLNEIGAVVIPSNVSEELKQRLRDNNIDFTEYNPEIEGDRQRAINEYEQYKFSLSDRALERGYGTYTEDISSNRPERNLPIVEDTELPFYESEETPEERMEDIRRRFADERFKKMIEKQTYKSINTATKMAKSYLDFNQKETTDFKNKISKLSKLAKDNLIKAKNYNQLKDIIKQYATKEQTFVNEEIKEAQKDIRKTQLIVSDDLKAQITDWSDFRKSSGLNIRKGEKSNVDTIYEELVNSYPGMLDASITNYADQLQELSDFLKRDNKYIEHFELRDDSINNITNKVWEKLSNNALTQQEINDLQQDIMSKAERRTREVVQQDLLETMGLSEQDLQVGKDVTSLTYQRTDPRRLNEKVFGYDVGQKINRATNGFVQHQEANKIRWQNKERAEIEALGIKARSKMSAAIQKYGEKQYVNDKGEVIEYNDQSLMSEFPNVQDQEKIKQAAEVLRQKYDDYIDRMNESLMDMGYDPVPKRKDYFRHFMELDDKLSQFGFTFSKENIMKEELPTDINGLTDGFKPGKNFFASTMARKGLKTTYDAITGIDQYLEGVGNVIYHTESIQRYRALSKLIRETYGQTHGTDNIEMMTPEEAQQRIQDVYDNKLSRYAAWLDEQANALAGKKAAIDRSVERIVGRKGYTLLNGLKKQVGSNMTGYNFRSAMTNFASAIQGASKTEILSSLKGFAFALRNYRNIDSLIEKSDMLATRFGTDSLSKKTWQKMSEAGQVFMNATDRFTTLQIWGGKYYEGLHHGLSEEQAIKQADDFTSRIMGDRSKGQTAEIFNSKTLGLFTQFQLEVNNQWSSMIHDNKMAMQQNPGLRSGLHIARQLGQLYAATWFFNNFMKATTGSDVMFDPIDILMGIFNPDDDKDIEEKTTEALGKLVNNLPMASIFTGGRIPLSEAFTGLDTGFKYITGQTDSFGNDISLSDVGNDLIASSFYYLFPTGFGQVKKTAQGLGMYNQVLPEPVENALGIYRNENLPVAGSYTKAGRLRFEADTTPIGVLQSAVFGRNASKEAREYRESGYETLTEKKVKEALEANLPISEYKKIDKEIRKVKKIAKDNKESQSEAEYNYIYNLPISMEQKNKLLNARKEYSDNITDDNGYVKYTDGNNTYWYDENNNKVYNSKYIEMPNIKISKLKKYSNLKDLTDYGKYGSLDEYNYANDNPVKYVITQQITDYDSYVGYKNKIAAIKDNYNNGTKAGQQKAQQEVFKYINSLPLNKYQKLMLQKLGAGYSIKNYESQVFNYINGLQLSKAEKQKIHKELFE